jgi:hypothetical protein
LGIAHISDVRALDKNFFLCRAQREQIGAPKAGGEARHLP